MLWITSFSFSLTFAMTHSVVNIIMATDAAFSNANLPTLVGSITPAASRFSYFRKQKDLPLKSANGLIQAVHLNK